jgi:hypothetical protein
MEFYMPTYNVHLYREMRLFFPGIGADTPEEAAKLAAEKHFDDAADFSDCEGENLSALVDLVGDEDYSESVTIDLDPMKSAAQELYEAAESILPDIERDIEQRKHSGNNEDWRSLEGLNLAKGDFPAK